MSQFTLTQGSAKTNNFVIQFQNNDSGETKSQGAICLTHLKSTE